MLFLFVLFAHGELPPRHQLILKFREQDRTSYEIAEECGKLSLRDGIKHVNILNAIGMCVLDFETKEDKNAIKESLLTDATVEDVSENVIVRVHNQPNEKLWSDMHHLVDIDAENAWGIFTGETAGLNTLVAIIDTGVDYTHPDLLDRMWKNPHEIPDDGLDNDGNGYIDDYYGVGFGWDGAEDPMDLDGHGTHCAGIVAAHGNNGEGVTGVVWEGVRLMALAFLTYGGSGCVSDAIVSLNYAFENGAMISSNSWGGPCPSPAMRAAIRAVSKKGHLFITAAGNDGADNDANGNFPCNYDVPNMLCVGSSSSDGSLSDFSNYGLTTVDVTAPGEEVYSTISWDFFASKPDPTYRPLSGTSMAAPVVAGVAALLKSFRPHLTGAELKSIIMSSVDTIPALDGKVASGGRVNAYKAIRKARRQFPANWTRYTTFTFADSSSRGTVSGVIDIQLLSLRSMDNLRFLVFYFATADTILGEIFRVNIDTSAVTSALHTSVEDIKYSDIYDSFLGFGRRLRSLYNVRNVTAPRMLYSAGWSNPNSFSYRLDAEQKGATHLAMSIANARRRSKYCIRVPIDSRNTALRF